MADEIQTGKGTLPNPSVPAEGSPVPLPWLTLPLATSAMLWACHFPLAWGWLGWIALVPLLSLVRSSVRPAKIYWGAYLAGLAFFVPVLQWMRVADWRMVFTWMMLASYCALYFPLALRLLRIVDRSLGLPLTLSVPIVWVGLEYLRSFLLTGFAWYYLGHTQHSFLPVIQIADLGGVYAVGFLLAAANGFLAELLLKHPEIRRVCSLPEPAPNASPFALLAQGSALVLAIGLTLSYGLWRLGQEEAEDGPVVALLQGNLDQRLRNRVFVEGAAGQPGPWKHYLDLCKLAVSRQPHPELVVWPETSFPYPWLDLPRDLNKVPESVREQADITGQLLRRLSRDMRSSHLFGLNASSVGEDGRDLHLFNAAILITPQGHLAGRYDKMHRIPFGEYVPLRDWLPFMDRFAPYEFDYSLTPGTKFTRFPLRKDLHFGVLTCFEDTDPFLAPRYVLQEEDGPPVDFLVNISNDGWFDGTSEHEEHLAIARFRAIETRRSLVRAVNMGISAVIDPDGRILEPELSGADPEGLIHWVVPARNDPKRKELPLGDWAGYKKVGGVLLAQVPIGHRSSLYARYGDVLPKVCWVVLGLALVVGLVRRTQKARVAR